MASGRGVQRSPTEDSADREASLLERGQHSQPAAERKSMAAIATVLLVAALTLGCVAAIVVGIVYALKPGPPTTTTTTTTTSMFPTEAPPAGFLPTCFHAAQFGWPVFWTADDLLQSPWASYFQRVYGEVPKDGYPLCLSSLKYIYEDIAQDAGIELPKKEQRCPDNDGDLYDAGQGHDPKDSLYVWNSDTVAPAQGSSIPSHHWIEFTHQVYKDDGEATWMYFLPGTGVWFNVGNSLVYNDHKDAARDLVGPGACATWDFECVSSFPKIYSEAKRRGYNSIQFLKHRDMPCGGTALEVVDLGGPGSSPCGSNTYRAGWRASAPCHCSETASTFTNCKGYMRDSLVI